ncbi:MAG: ATP synthase F0 subunit B [Clostridia bacterium]|nr:ATP synthase F0 subunit B [Clostridia bacterium]
MADLISKDMIADLIINILNILILFFLTKALLYKPVKKFLDVRKTRLAEEKQAALDAEASAQARKAEYDALLADAEASKAALLQEAEANAQEKARQILAEAKQKAEETAQNAAAAAVHEREKMLSDARDEIADLALEISAKIIGREVTDADNLAIAKRFFGDAEE